MTNEHFNPHYQPDEPEQDPFAKLDVFEHDIAFREVLERVDTLQLALGTETMEDAYNAVEELNEDLYDSNQLGERVIVTGKVRVAPWINGIALADDMAFHGENVRMGEDERGAYCELNGVPLVLGLVSLDADAEDDHVDDEDPEDASALRHVLTFHTPSQVSRASHEPGDMADLMSSDGDFVIYPEELLVLKYEQPSIPQVEQTLRLYYPDIYRTIDHQVAEFTGTKGDRMLHDLQGLRLPVEELDSDLRRDIGRLLYARIAVDDEADYRFTLSGPMGTVTAEDELIYSAQPRDARLHARLVTIDINEETGRPLFVASELSSSGIGYEARLIPVEHVKRLFCLRPLQGRFGRMAMQHFVDPDDVRLYWHRHRETLLGELDDADAVLSDAAAIVDELESELVYNPRGFYEQLVTDDVTRLQNSFEEHRELANATTPDELAMDAFTRAINKEVRSLDALELGDTVMTAGRTIFQYEELGGDDQPVAEVSLLNGQQRLTGEFAGLVVVPFPNEVAIESAGEQWAQVMSLGMIMREARVFTQRAVESDEDDAANEAIDQADDATFGQPVVVLLAPFTGTVMTKAYNVAGEE